MILADSFLCLHFRAFYAVSHRSLSAHVFLCTFSYSFPEFASHFLCWHFVAFSCCQSPFFMCNFLQVFADPLSCVYRVNKLPAAPDALCTRSHGFSPLRNQIRQITGPTIHRARLDIPYMSINFNIFQHLRGWKVDRGSRLPAPSGVPYTGKYQVLTGFSVASSRRSWKAASVFLLYP